MRFQSLHTHTLASDGKLTHEEVWNTAREAGIGVVAYTDHDTVLNESALMFLEGVRGEEQKWISGIEISAGLPEDLGEESVSGLHILGLFVDPTNAALREHGRRASEARVERMQRIVGSLREFGFEITENDCLAMSEGEAVGRPHIVSALLAKDHNVGVMEGMRHKMQMEALKDEGVKEKYDHMMRRAADRGIEQYPYNLFLGADPYLPGVSVEYTYFPTLDEAVTLIRNAGGVALVAHYFTIRKKIPFESLEILLKDDRLDGMETVYALARYGNAQDTELAQERGRVKELVAKYDKLASGGADAHKREDFTHFSQNTHFAEETIGMAENIIASGKVDTRWSSF